MAGRTRVADARVPIGIVASAVAATVLHFLALAWTHSSPSLPFVAQKLYLIPIIGAAAGYGLGGSLAAAAAVSCIFLAHVLREGSGPPTVHADQAAEVVGFVLVAVVASRLLSRERFAREEAHRAHEDALRALASSLELRESSTAGHSERVRSYSLLIAEALGVDGSHLAALADGALLHDIGKIGISDAVLLKQGALDESQWLEMRRHAELGAALIGNVPTLAGVRELVLAHHERFDGKGYPRRLAGEAIPLAARVFAVADTFDAMTANRPYHRQSSLEEARRAILEARGTQFDPVVADAFLALPVDAIVGAASHHGFELRREPRALPAERP